MGWNFPLVELPVELIVGLISPEYVIRRPVVAYILGPVWTEYVPRRSAVAYISGHDVHCHFVPFIHRHFLIHFCTNCR